MNNRFWHDLNQYVGYFQNNVKNCLHGGTNTITVISIFFQQDISPELCHIRLDPRTKL